MGRVHRRHREQDGRKENGESEDAGAPSHPRCPHKDPLVSPADPRPTLRVVMETRGIMVWRRRPSWFTHLLENRREGVSGVRDGGRSTEVPQLLTHPPSPHRTGDTLKYRPTGFAVEAQGEERHRALFSRRGHAVPAAGVGPPTRVFFSLG